MSAIPALRSMHGVAFAPHAQVRVGVIGLGGRGSSLTGALMAVGARVDAIADVSQNHIEAAAQRVRATQGHSPRMHAGDDGWRHVVDTDIDLVLIATPWATHTPFAVAAMEAGKHVAVEVPAAETVEACWQLVEASERARRHCVMLENCCYDYWEMLVKRMVQADLLGTLTHAECAYIHNLRSLLLTDRGEGLWRRAPHLHRNGNLYPTHGLGPVAQCLRIGQDDAFDYLVSMSSREASLSEYRDATLPQTDAKRNEYYASGDMNISLIRTRQGRTIVLQHDVVTPRPYDRVFLIAGTRGMFRDYPPRLFLDGKGDPEAQPIESAWLPREEYQPQWEDPLWTTLGDIARRDGGHGGCDYMMLYRLIACMREGLPPEMDVYDAADWSVPGPLSDASVARRSMAVAFPDFRRSRNT